MLEDKAEMPPEFDRGWASRYASKDVTRVIVIENPQLAAANDAGWVIRRLRDDGLNVDAWRIICRNSDGCWNGLVTKAGVFLGYVSLGYVTNKQLAIKVALAREPWISQNS